MRKIIMKTKTLSNNLWVCFAEQMHDLNALFQLAVSVKFMN